MDIRTKEEFLAALNDRGCKFGLSPYYVTSVSDIICQSCAQSESDLICEAIDVANTYGRDQWDGHYNVTLSRLTDEDDSIFGLMCDHFSEWIEEPEPANGPDETEGD